MVKNHVTLNRQGQKAAQDTRILMARCQSPSDPQELHTDSMVNCKAESCTVN